ncbi:MAG: hypothetical protein RLZ12_617 [Bacillota bacterium]|jgi:hypothetical protein
MNKVVLQAAILTVIGAFAVGGSVKALDCPECKVQMNCSIGNNVAHCPQCVISYRFTECPLCQDLVVRRGKIVNGHIRSQHGHNYSGAEQRAAYKLMMGIPKKPKLVRIVK